MRPVSVTIVEAFFGRPPSYDESGLQISELASTQLLHGDRLKIELAIFDGIITSGTFLHSGTISRGS